VGDEFKLRDKFIKKRVTHTELKSTLSATDGNLGGHVRKLEDAGTFHATKRLKATPRTDYRLTASGRRALEKYLNHLDAIIRAARSS
jgi:DNA-binding MarR family transcriptional regulator